MQVGDLVRYTHDDRIGVVAEVYGLVCDMATIFLCNGEYELIYGDEVELLCR